MRNKELSLAINSGENRRFWAGFYLARLTIEMHFSFWSQQLPTSMLLVHPTGIRRAIGVDDEPVECWLFLGSTRRKSL